MLDKGLVKAENFIESNNKRGYLYKLTPAGISEKAAVTTRFLKAKMSEFEKLKSEIQNLKNEVENQGTFEWKVSFLPAEPVHDFIPLLW